MLAYKEDTLAIFFSYVGIVEVLYRDSESIRVNIYTWRLHTWAASTVVYLPWCNWNMDRAILSGFCGLVHGMDIPWFAGAFS